MEKSVERLALDKCLQATLVKTQSTEDVGEGSDDFACRGNLQNWSL